ncbi:hypothetical protein JTB14_013678 [Gonioctena quinquepunctata]|nr:hypothetical protein JTB14_013678 [Gonioctena quinquepunctata]
MECDADLINYPSLGHVETVTLEKINPKQARSLLILACALSIILVVRLQTRTPQFSTADNPTARETDFLTRLLTFSYLPVFNFWLLLFPNTLSFDWGMEAIPRITTIRDKRNIVTLAFYFGLVQVFRRCLRSVKLGAVVKVKSYHSCAVCQINCYDLQHSSSCRATNNNNSMNYQSSSCVCYIPRKSSLRTDRQSLTSSSAVLLSLAFLALPFLPATNILFYVGFVVAERVLYLPSAGLCLLLGLAGGVFWDRYKRLRPVFSFCLVIVLVAFSAKTVFRNRDWRDEESLYRSAIPINTPKAYGNLGSVLSSQGRFVEAELAFREALRYRPNMADVHTICRVTFRCLATLILL